MNVLLFFANTSVVAPATYLYSIDLEVYLFGSVPINDAPGSWLGLRKLAAAFGLNGLNTNDEILAGAVKVNSSGANDSPLLVDTFCKLTSKFFFPGCLFTFLDCTFDVGTAKEIILYFSYSITFPCVLHVNFTIFL